MLSGMAFPGSRSISSQLGHKWAGDFPWVYIYGVLVFMRLCVSVSVVLFLFHPFSGRNIYLSTTLTLHYFQGQFRVAALPTDSTSHDVEPLRTQTAKRSWDISHVFCIILTPKRIRGRPPRFSLTYSLDTALLQFPPRRVQCHAYTSPTTMPPFLRRLITT